LHPSSVAKSSTSFGWGKGGNVTSAEWQVTLCDPIWHVSSRSGDGRPACKLLCAPFTFLYLYLMLYLRFLTQSRPETKTLSWYYADSVRQRTSVPCPWVIQEDPESFQWRVWGRYQARGQYVSSAHHQNDNDNWKRQLGSRNNRQRGFSGF